MFVASALPRVSYPLMCTMATGQKINRNKRPAQSKRIENPADVLSGSLGEYPSLLVVLSFISVYLAQIIFHRIYRGFINVHFIEEPCVWCKYLK